MYRRREIEENKKPLSDGRRKRHKLSVLDCQVCLSVISPIVVDRRELAPFQPACVLNGC